MNELDKLKDIKVASIIQIDFLPYMYVVLAFVLFIFVIIVFIMFFKNKKRVKVTKEQLAKQALLTMDFTLDTKSIVYCFTVNGYECLEDKNKDEFEQILQKLESYKYKKVVTQLSDELIEDMKDYIKVRV